MFQGHLEVNIFSEDIATGEIHKMFNPAGTYNPKNKTNGLFHDIRSMFQFPVWHIEGVGNYHYLPVSTQHYFFTNDWWEASDNGGPEGYYYLEQKLGDEYTSDESDFAVAKGGIRNNLLEKYSDSSNALSISQTKIVTKFAEQLIPLAVQYSAGFSAYWYSMVNSPPYLKAVKVK